MTKPILGTLAVVVVVALPLAMVGTNSGNQGIQFAQAGSISEKCAQLKDPQERAACIREGKSGREGW